MAADPARQLPEHNGARIVPFPGSRLARARGDGDGDFLDQGVDLPHTSPSRSRSHRHDPTNVDQRSPREQIDASNVDVTTDVGLPRTLRRRGAAARATASYLARRLGTRKARELVETYGSPLVRRALRQHVLEQVIDEEIRQAPPGAERPDESRWPYELRAARRWEVRCDIANPGGYLRTLLRYMTPAAVDSTTRTINQDTCVPVQGTVLSETPAAGVMLPETSSRPVAPVPHEAGPPKRACAERTPRAPDVVDRTLGVAASPAAATSGDARELWERVLERLKDQVSPPNFESWLAATMGVELQRITPTGPRELVVGVARDFQIEWLRSRMNDQIGRVLKDVAGEPVTLRYEVLA